MIIPLSDAPHWHQRADTGRRYTRRRDSPWPQPQLLCITIMMAYMPYPIMMGNRTDPDGPTQNFSVHFESASTISFRLLNFRPPCNGIQKDTGVVTARQHEVLTLTVSSVTSVSCNCCCVHFRVVQMNVSGLNALKTHDQWLVLIQEKKGKVDSR